MLREKCFPACVSFFNLTKHIRVRKRAQVQKYCTSNVPILKTLLVSFHALLPDIQASLGEVKEGDVHKDMTKAVTVAVIIDYACSVSIALLGFVAFGVDVASNVWESVTVHLSPAIMYTIWTVLVIKTLTEAAVYNQAAFALFRDIVGIAENRFNFGMRLLYIVASVLVAIYVPYFGDLCSVVGTVASEFIWFPSC